MSIKRFFYTFIIPLFIVTLIFILAFSLLKVITFTSILITSVFFAIPGILLYYAILGFTKLFIDYKNKKLGTRFQLKLTIIFMLLTFGSIVPLIFVTTELVSKAVEITSTLQTYQQILIFREPIKNAIIVVIVSLGLLLLVISIFLSFILAKSISEPVIKLSEATKKVATGDLDFVIEHNSKDEMKFLIDSFNQMIKELKANRQAIQYSQKLSAWQEVAKRFSTEIRKPLAPIKQSAEFLRNNVGSSKELLIHVTTIQEQIANLERYINDFSILAKISKVKITMENLNSIIQEAILELKFLPENIKIKTYLDETLPLLPLDKSQIKQVILNLINNSIAQLESNNDGKIIIRTYKNPTIFGEFYCFEISDNGKGLSAEAKEHIFEPSFSSTDEGRRGVNLAMVEKILEDHKAKIKFESELNRGTKFIIEFSS